MRPSRRILFAVLALAVLTFAFHIYFNDRYDYFRDEFDYMACGEHLDWGFVDHPPLIPFLVKLCRVTFGDGLRSIRLVPALASSGLLVLTALIALELGGGAFAVLLSAVAVLIAPIYLSDGSLMTTNCLEPLLWMGCAYCAILAIRRDQPRYWLWFGVIAGIGLEEKYSIAMFCFALVAGLFLTPHRTALLSKWMWLGAAAALLIFLPNLLWNSNHHWPFLELMRNIKAEGRDVVLSPVQYFLQQVLLIHPLTAPVWITGLVALLVWRPLRPYRFLGVSYLICFALFVALKGKNYYLAPVYPMLLASGAVAIGSVLESRRWMWARVAIVAVLLAAGAWFAPVVVPVLPVDRFIAYQNRLPVKVPRSEHSHIAAVLPQHYADQFGWREIAAAAAEGWKRIPEADRRDCGVFAQDYGQAGAIDFFGRQYGLPPALSGHQSYWLWGPRGYSGNCLVVLGDRPEVLRTLFDRVEYVTTSADNPYALERDVPVFICRGAKFGSLEKLWPQVKKWR